MIILTLNVDVIEKREEHDYFLRNPNLYEFRKVNRPLTARRQLTPRDTHP